MDDTFGMQSCFICGNEMKGPKNTCSECLSLPTLQRCMKWPKSPGSIPVPIDPDLDQGTAHLPMTDHQPDIDIGYEAGEDDYVIDLTLSTDDESEEEEPTESDIEFITEHEDDELWSDEELVYKTFIDDMMVNWSDQQIIEWRSKYIEMLPVKARDHFMFNYEAIINKHL